MKRKIMSILAAVFTFSMIFGMNAMASSRMETIELKVNQVWNVRDYVTRSKQYSKVSAICYGVYPVNGGEDNYRYIQVVARNTSGNNITEEYTLDEKEDSATFMEIKDGKLNVSKVVFAFRGNNPNYSAKAEVLYNGR